MTLRFLQTVPSANPEYPFLPGQILTGLSRLSPEMRQWVREGRAEIVGAADELAVAPTPTRAVTRKRAR